MQKTSRGGSASDATFREPVSPPARPRLTLVLRSPPARLGEPVPFIMTMRRTPLLSLLALAAVAPFLPAHPLHAQQGASTQTVPGSPLPVATLSGPSLSGPSLSGPPLSSAHPAYALLESLDLLGGASAWMSGAPSVSRGVLTHELARARTGQFLGEDEGLDRALSKWESRFLAERAPLLFEVGGREGDAFLDPGTGGYIGARVEAALPWWGTPDGLSLWAHTRLGGSTNAPTFETGGISAPLGPFNLTVGRFPLKGVGPGGSNAILGGNVPLDLVLLTSRRLISLPGLDWLFKAGEGQFAFGPFAGIGDLDQGWMAHAMVRSRPHPNFRIGATRSVHFARSEALDPFAGKPATFDRLLRTFLIRANTPYDWDDQKAELSLEFRGTVLGQPLAPYVVLSMEDGPPYLDPGLHAGVRTAGRTPSGLWMLHYAYAAFGERARWCRFCDRVTHDEFGQGFSERGRDAGPWYVHGAARWPYIRDGIPLGDPLGGYGARHRIDAWYFPHSAGWHARASVFEERRERWNLLEDRWPGVRRGVGVEGTVEAVVAGRRVHVSGDGILADDSWALNLGVRLDARLGDPPRPDPRSTPSARAESVDLGGMGGRASAPLRALARGATVDITSPALLHRRAEGVLVGLDPAAGRLTFEDATGQRHDVPLATLERLQIGSEPRRGTLEGTLRGALIGATLGIVAGVLLDEETRTDQGQSDIRWATRLGALSAGAAAGGAVGWSLPLRRWTRVPM